MNYSHYHIHIYLPEPTDNYDLLQGETKSNSSSNSLYGNYQRKSLQRILIYLITIIHWTLLIQMITL